MPTDANAAAGDGSAVPVRFDRRIDLRMPLTIAALLAAVVSLFSWLAYVEIRDEAMSSANLRLGDVSHRLADITGKSMAALLDATNKFSARQELKDAFGAPAAELDAKTRAYLDPLVKHNTQLMALELWNPDGTLRLAVLNDDYPGAATCGGVAPSWADPEHASIGGLKKLGKEVLLPVSGPVRGDKGVVGTV